MKGKLLIGSIFTVMIIILVSFVSVVGYQAVKVNNNESSSPLFTIRTQRAIQKVSENNYISNFIGKNKEIYLGFSNSISLPTWVEQLVDWIEKNTKLIDKLFENILVNPELLNLLLEQGITRNQILLLKNEIKQNPEVIKTNLMKAIRFNPNIKSWLNDIRSKIPLGLKPPNTYSFLECTLWLILALPLLLLVLPLALIVFIATLSIIGCIIITLKNPDRCDIGYEIWQIFQGLEQPD